MRVNLKNISNNHKQINSGKFSVAIANDAKSIDECLRLRYEIFSGEMGANIHGIEVGLDKDRFDDYCQHLMVIEKSTDRVIATTRLLPSSEIKNTGNFYSETEFDLRNIHKLQGSILEVGRTCIHKNFRRSIVLSKLWQGIALIISQTKTDYLIGCASIPLNGGEQYLNSLMHKIHINHYSHPKHRVHPHIKLNVSNTHQPGDVILPTLLKGYLRQGAVICGEPYWDAEFGVADVFVLLDCKQISARYSKYFIEKLSA